MPESKKDSFNASRLSQLADLLREFNFGDILRALPSFIRRSGTVASPYVTVASLATVSQAQEAAAAAITSAYARAGAGTPGPLIVDAPSSTAPAAGHVVVMPNGSIVTATADAWTDLDVTYLVEKGEIFEYTGSVVAATGVMALPTSAITQGVVILLEAESLAGGLISKMHVIEPAAAAVATTKSALKTSKDQVWFAIADAVTSARVKLLLVSAVDVNTKLEETALSL